MSYIFFISENVVHHSRPLPDLPSSDNEAGGGSGSISGGIRDSTSLGNTSLSLEGKPIVDQIQAFLSNAETIKTKL